MSTIKVIDNNLNQQQNLEDHDRTKLLFFYYNNRLYETKVPISDRFLIQGVNRKHHGQTKHKLIKDNPVSSIAIFCLT